MKSRALALCQVETLHMRIAGTVVGIILILLGGLWILQGSNVIGGSVMSGQSQWLYIGIVVLIVGAIALWWTYRRRA
jgi:Na+/melibiose symporter-like transporter